MAKNRVEAITDGIYAIAMTILVLNIDISRIADEVTQNGLGVALWSMMPEFYGYFLGFFLLGSLWLVHNRQYRRVINVTESFFWINIVSLVLICLIPFSVSLISQYENDLMAVCFFHLNLLLAGLSYLGQWLFLTGNQYLLTEKINIGEINRIKYRNLILPVISLVAIVAAFFSPEWSSMAYLLIPVFKRFI